ncbi:unnamed protein product [Phytophthora fragariaefolia]|uniref:Unnamed protein product n=1 Tax=Phytophthora fragariaefolia TaxID=1490495 RepID=A0A9W6TZE1_9STRA|nr:unnamed protein product [Phytophthora fragariaefolia]
MRTLFSDSEDKSLVRFAFAYEGRGAPVVCSDLQRRMRSKKYFVKQLRVRLHSLKKTYGNTLAGFPKSFFSTKRRVTPVHSVRPSATPALAGVIPDGDAGCEWGSACKLGGKGQSYDGGNGGVGEAAAARGSGGGSSGGRVGGGQVAGGEAVEVAHRGGDACVAVLPMTSDEAMRTVEIIFASVNRNDVRQQAGKRHLNAGEILPSDVTALVEALGGVWPQDTFLDVGCGIGNVVVQFVLQTAAKKCYGIEVRSEVLACGARLISGDAPIQNNIAKTSLICADAGNIMLVFEQPYNRATIVLTHHRLFIEAIKLLIEEQTGLHCHARAVIFGENICPRHQASCRATFCARWKVLHVPVSWTSRSELWIYLRRKRLSN